MYKGYLDGIDEPLTQKAIMSYEEQLGKQITGKISNHLIKHIQSEILNGFKSNEQKTNSNGFKKPEKQTSDEEPQFILLAIPIALIAYLGSLFIKIREIISFLKKEKQENEKKIQNNDKEIDDLKQRNIDIEKDITRHSTNLSFLLFGDICLIFLGLANIFVIADITLNIGFIPTNPYQYIIGFLCLTILYLCFLHFLQWKHILGIIIMNWK